MKDSSDRLYNLLPVIYRLRDAELGWPLRGLLGVISEQVQLVEDDITQLYDNWFIETCQDWVTPYIGDLVGYKAVHDAGEPGDVTTSEGQARNKILISRRDVAETIRNRRRKGTLALLEDLALDAAGWPAHAVEFYALLDWLQNINHLHLDRGRTVSVRDGDALAWLDGPFDRLAHTVDVRQINSHRQPGRYNIPSVGLYVWRLKDYSVTRGPAYCVEDVEPNCYTFSALGNDTPLYVHPENEGRQMRVQGDWNFPMPVSRQAFEKYLMDFYGEGKSMAIWANWSSFDMSAPIPAQRIIAADLSDWKAYTPPVDTIALDPRLGRFVFPPDQTPKKHVRVLYHYGFSAEVGGGEYNRSLAQPVDASLYLVGEKGPHRRINDALAKWRNDQPKQAIIEITDSSIYVEQIDVKLGESQSLQIRAANGKRPIIRLQDWQTELPDALSISLDKASRITLDGLLITGRPVQISGGKGELAQEPVCSSRITIRHCTLVPGWGLDSECNPRRPAEASLELFNVRAQVKVENSILGSIQVYENQVRTEPAPLEITDSILDATGDEREALGAPGSLPAHVFLTIRRSTVFGIIDVHAVELAENTIFNNCLNVARRQLGCMRFCYVPRGCRTPRRYNCQPDLAEADAEKQVGEDLNRRSPKPSQAAIAAAQKQAGDDAVDRLRPQYTERLYGRPGYAQLALSCAGEIKRGADDEAEMGVFHDLFQPQREANLRARLDEYTPAGMDAGIIFVS